MLHQIQADIERSAPAQLFAQPVVSALFERLLYVYHSRHPATGYVQGMNDLVMPFFAVFLSPYVGLDLEECDVASIAPDVLSEIEADSYWCFNTMVDMIQDYFTPDRYVLYQRQRTTRGSAPLEGLWVFPCLFSRPIAPLPEHSCIESQQVGARHPLPPPRGVPIAAPAASARASGGGHPPASSLCELDKQVSVQCF
jgi:hypothetical protein